MQGNVEEERIVTRLKGKITSIVIDDTLTKKGQCAEAKAVGDAIANLQSQINSIVSALSKVEEVQDDS